MKKILYLALLIPVLGIAQNSPEPLIIENMMLTVLPGHVKAFEEGVAAHNKKYHTAGPYQSSVFLIDNGKNSGKYIWNMGPLPWSAMDGSPSTANGHNADWEANIAPHVASEVDLNYWRMHADLSDFSKDFTLNKLSVFMIDVKRFKDMEFMEKVVKKVHQVYMSKMPDQRHGIYTNEMPAADGPDFAWVDFFDSMGWMGKPDTFVKDFEAVHGAGSFTAFLADVEATTNSQSTEIWVFRPDLSGNDGHIVAATRQ